jgi:hypothetical protein
MEELTKEEINEATKKLCEKAGIKELQGQKPKTEENKKITLEQLHDIYKENLYIEDDKRIDVVLATALSNKLSGIPIWLIIVGASGDMKSVQLNAIRGENVALVHNLTSKTLVNGFKDKNKFPDLAPALDGKIVIIPDMAQILKLPPNEKGELWGQLRDLYDGYAGKNSGMGSTAQYKDLKITLIAGSTPAIDSQILVHQDLGTRELIYRTKGNKEKEKVMQKCFLNEETEKEITERLEKATYNFLNNREIKRTAPSSEIEKELMKIATFIMNMRATAEFDSYTNELRNYVYPEEPTRICKQLKRLYVCLKALADDYSDEKALKILWHIGRSSAFPIRTDIFEHLFDGNEHSTSAIAEALYIGKSSTKRECAVLEALGLITCRREPTNHPERTYDYWKINLNNPFVSSLNINPSMNVIERVKE